MSYSNCFYELISFPERVIYIYWLKHLQLIIEYVSSYMLMVNAYIWYKIQNIFPVFMLTHLPEARDK
jgi:hypothetical protein